MYRFLSPGLIVLVPRDLNLTLYAHKSGAVDYKKPIHRCDRFNYLLDI